MFMFEFSFVGVLPACICVFYILDTHANWQRTLNHWNQIYGWLLASVCLLGTEAMSSCALSI